MAQIEGSFAQLAPSGTIWIGAASPLIDDYHGMASAISEALH
ncbi:MAG TPA: hypothetical protein VKU19_08380 [Bryobacteraceae bacterium]|nr:hypothetical protein [Bryobacteraceae bacterium]